jgi:acetyltransferase-like isoleucine patch superfamily enzyme
MSINLLIYKILDWLGRQRDLALSYFYSARLASCGPRSIIRKPRVILGGSYINVGASFDVFPGLRIEAIDLHLGKRFTPRIIIGDRVSINYDCHIGCINEVVIGSDVLIASRVYISDHCHGALDYHDIDAPPSLRKIYSKGSVIIEDGVLIGEGACIMPGVRIGRHAIVGANSVVTRDVATKAIVAGCPARQIKSLSSAEL